MALPPISICLSSLVLPPAASARSQTQPILDILYYIRSRGGMLNIL